MVRLGDVPGPHHVTRGGEPLTFALSPTVTATKVSVGPGDNNAYLLDTGTDLLLVDAADDATTLLDVLGERGGHGVHSAAILWPAGGAAGRSSWARRVARRRAAASMAAALTGP